MEERPQPNDRFGIRALLPWYAVSWVFLGLAPPVVAVQDDPGAMYWSLALSAVLGLAYLLLWVRFLPVYGFLGALFLGLGGMAYLPGGGAAMFIMTLPHFWIYGGGVRPAIGFSGAAGIATVVGLVVREENLLTGNAVATVIGFAASVLLGLWMHRIVEQGDERTRQLRAELDLAQLQLAEAQRREGATAERDRMAREIHDTLAQGFASIVVLAEAARVALAADPGKSVKQLQSIESTARENLAEARILVGAAPASQRSLVQALRRTLDRFAEDTGISVTAELPDIELDQSARIALLRCTQESLANVRRHAAASVVGVVLAQYDDRVELEITDDGRGFVVGQSPGFGLAGMRRRLAELSGELTVTSSVGDGTRILAAVPLDGASR